MWSLQDINFRDQPYASKVLPIGGSPLYFGQAGWSRTTVEPIAFFTDKCLELSKLNQWKDSRKFALILEPYAIDPSPYHALIYGGYDQFEKVFLHHKNWLNRIPNAEYYPNWMFWSNTLTEDHPKDKLISTVISNKQLTESQKLRHWLPQILGDRVDYFGSKFKWVEDKSESLASYKFQVVIENCSEPGYFSEKILDCFINGVIPIYYGDPDISDFFDPEGVLAWSTTEQLLEFVTDIHNGSIKHEDLLYSIETNYFKALQYNTLEDYLYNEIQHQ